MVFADLRMGDYFSLGGKPYMRLQEYIMSLDKYFFGIVYTPPVGNCLVEFLPSFEYELNSYYIAVDIDTNNVPIDKAPCNVLLQSVGTNSLYAKVKSCYGTGFIVVYVKMRVNQGKFWGAEKMNMNVRIIDKMTIVYDEENI